MKPRELWTERVKCPFCDQEQLVFLDLVGIGTQRVDESNVIINLDVRADPIKHKCLFFAEEDDPYDR